ncbi:Site-specific recombinase XerD [Algoriella xinjiangensis]|nr:Site-specific recombinase XerD [Algoriella xinjiangensis]
MGTNLGTNSFFNYIALNYYCVIMATIAYSIRSSKNDKLSSIYLRFRDSSRIDVNLAVNYLNCLPSNFKNGKCKVSSYKVKESDTDTLNVILEKLKTHVLGDFLENEHSITNAKLWLKQSIESFNNADEQKDLDDFIVFLDYYLDSKVGSVADSTYKKIKTEITKLKKFVTDSSDFFKAGQKIRFKNLNDSFLRRYEDYLESLNYQSQTYSKKVKNLKQVCVFAKQNNIVVNEAIFNWKFKVFKKPNDAKFIYLNFEELQSITDLKLKTGYLDNARDWLLIACFTGQRVSDFLQFNKGNIKKDSDLDFIEFTQQKTKKLMKIPILDAVQAVLDKNKGNFPRNISATKFNVYIKEVCKKAGIIEKVFGGKPNQGTNNRKIYDTYYKYELVTSHIGRRSFATNFYGLDDTNVNDLMYVTGHNSQKQFLDYIQKTNEERGIEVAKAFKKIKY